MPAKRIYLNQREKVIGGVCAGIADYFDIDVAWVRLAFVLSIFAEGFGILAYIVAWIVFPKDERSRAQVEAQHAGVKVEVTTDDGQTTRVKTARFGSGSRNAIGIILVLLGLLFFMDQNFYWFRFDSFWPLLLIALGGYMLYRAAQPEDAEVAINTSAHTGTASVSAGDTAAKDTPSQKDTPDA